MPEETQTAEVAQTSTAETTAAVSQTAEQTPASTEPVSQETKVDTEAGKGADQAANTGDQKQNKDQSQDPKTETKPVSRRSAQYRLNQLLKENQELKAKVQPNAAEGEGNQPAADDPKPDIEGLIAKEVERRLNPVLSEHSKAADDSELNELFSGDKAGERAKYESKIRNMWNLQQYKDVAAADLYKIASFDDAVKAATAKAIEDYKAAEIAAKESSGSGNSNNSNRTGSGKPPMSDEELLAHNERVKAGQQP